ncbi:GIY-YIG nuclease family protein [uncultured Croceitalea sp.]|uniref:GIY-YIG nuclease family protein n=2 Tax=uncultured Croceitalea sp. TaxID=1798908 RepID=UPI0033063E37
MMFCVYVIKSRLDGRLYKGMTQNLERRVSEHNAGKVKSTKGYAPWDLAYFEKYDSRALARDREKYFKSGSGREFLKQKLAT